VIGERDVWLICAAGADEKGVTLARCNDCEVEIRVPPSMRKVHAGVRRSALVCPPCAASKPAGYTLLTLATVECAHALERHGRN